MFIDFLVSWRDYRKNKKDLLFCIEEICFQLDELRNNLIIEEDFDRNIKIVKIEEDQFLLLKEKYKGFKDLLIEIDDLQEQGYFSQKEIGKINFAYRQLFYSQEFIDTLSSFFKDDTMEELKEFQ